MTKVLASHGRLLSSTLGSIVIFGFCCAAGVWAQLDSPRGAPSKAKVGLSIQTQKDYFYVIPKSRFGLTEFRANYYPLGNLAPYALLNGVERVWVCPKTSDRYFFDFDIAIHTREPISKIEGTLFLPDRNKIELDEHQIEVNLDGPVGRTKFLEALTGHYRYLVRGNFTGKVWFQHRLDEINRELNKENLDRNNTIRRSADPLDRTFSLFSGARAISENIQLDRDLQNVAPGDTWMDVKGIEGITIKEFDWAPHLDAKLPELDPLASYIPHDQHVVFSNSPQQLMQVLNEVSSFVAPSMSTFSAESVDRQVIPGYFRQMAIDVAEISRQEFAGRIKSVAITGSDPYSELGTDLGVVIEMESEAAAKDFANYYLRKIGSDDSLNGFTNSGWNKTADRALSAYCFQKQSLFVVANSEFQIRRIDSVIEGKFKPLASLLEYRFFRQRYTRSADESAFVFMSDAAIRRWCSAKWRISQSRRLRALAVMQRMQAKEMKTCLNIDEDKMVKSNKIGQRNEMLGQISLSRTGIHSSKYGTIKFMTPISELDVQKVSAQEKSAYERWRNRYQSNWNQAFDPIGIQLKVKPTSVEIDLSVIPLIMSSSYRWLADGKPMDAFAGDLHPGSLIHLVAAPGLQNELKQFLGGLQFIEAYADEDRSFWRDFTDEQKAEEHFRKNIQKLPVALVFHFDNAENMQKALGTRRFIESSLVEDTELKYKGETYRRMEFEEQFLNPGDDKNLLLYGYKQETKICFSLSEKLIHQAIERKLEEKKPEGIRPWLGKNLAIQLDQRFFRALEGMTAETYRKSIRRQSWRNLPILNEWKKEFPEMDALELHASFWGEKLVCPGGGKFQWDSKTGSYMTTAFGNPVRPRIPMGTPFPLRDINTVDGGLSFATGGIRAKLVLKKK